MNDIERLSDVIKDLQCRRAKLCRWLYGKHAPTGQEFIRAKDEKNRLDWQIHFLRRQRLARTTISVEPPATIATPGNPPAIDRPKAHEARKRRLMKP